MEKSINILDKDYVQWVKELSLRYRQSQIRSAVKVNQEMLRFYWELGKDIVNMNAENKYGSKFYPTLSKDLAKEILKDPYNFAFAGITGKYNERKLKDALIDNITKFLMELGTGFAYVGKEYRLQIGYTEKFVDLLFYNLNLSCRHFERTGTNHIKTLTTSRSGNTATISRKERQYHIRYHWR